MSYMKQLLEERTHMNKFIGIDCETSSLRLEDGATLIQIGVAIRDTDGTMHTYHSLVNPEKPMFWDIESFKVHGIPAQKVADAPKASKVDEELVNWLLDHGLDVGAVHRNIPIGFNVATFDMPFIKDVLPRTFALLSWRTIELNSIAWAFDGKDSIAYKDWKEIAKDHASKHIITDDVNKAHHAGWDAQMHLLTYEYFNSVIKGQG